MAAYGSRRNYQSDSMTSSRYNRSEARQRNRQLEVQMETDDGSARSASVRHRSGSPEQEPTMSVQETSHTNKTLVKTHKLLEIVQTLSELGPGIKKEIEELERYASRAYAEQNTFGKEQERTQQLMEENEQLKRKLEQTQSYTRKNDKHNLELEQIFKAKDEENKLLTKDVEHVVDKYNTLKVHYETIRADLEQEQQAKDHVQHLLEQEKENLKKGTEVNKRLVDRLKVEIAENDVVKNQVREKEETIQRNKKEFIDMKKELDETKSRLSMMMGNKMKAGNPDIADLSDKNRPTKLAETYTELYDNEWTDALDTLQNSVWGSASKDEKDSVKQLYSILMDVHKFCKKEAENQTEQLKQCLLIDYKHSTHISDSSLQQLMEFRRSNAECGVEGISEKYLRSARSRLSRMAENANRVSDFVKGCVRICWLMSCQFPPLAFDVDSGSMTEYNKDKYKAYTKLGNYIDYVVWPPLLLHEGGPMLAKGVVQCYSPQQKYSQKTDLANTNVMSGREPMQTWGATSGVQSNVSYETITYTPSTVTSNNDGDTGLQHPLQSAQTAAMAGAIGQIAMNESDSQRRLDEILQTLSSKNNEYDSLASTQLPSSSVHGSRASGQNTTTGTTNQSATTQYRNVPLYNQGTNYTRRQ